MTARITIIRKAHCLLTAHRLEYRWRRLLRLKKKENGQACYRKKLLLEKAKIDYLSALYAILTKGADHPERLAI